MLVWKVAVWEQVVPKYSQPVPLLSVLQSGALLTCSPHFWVPSTSVFQTTVYWTLQWVDFLYVHLPLEEWSREEALACPPNRLSTIWIGSSRIPGPWSETWRADSLCMAMFLWLWRFRWLSRAQGRGLFTLVHQWCVLNPMRGFIFFYSFLGQ